MGKFEERVLSERTRYPEQGSKELCKEKRGHWSKAGLGYAIYPVAKRTENTRPKGNLSLIFEFSESYNGSQAIIG